MMAMPVVYRIRVCRACGEVGSGMDTYCLRCRERGTLEDRYECERCRRIYPVNRCAECERDDGVTALVPASANSRPAEAPTDAPRRVDIRLPDPADAVRPEVAGFVGGLAVGAVGGGVGGMFFGVEWWLAAILGGLVGGIVGALCSRQSSG
jgi:hypothetical protein